MSAMRLPRRRRRRSHYMLRNSARSLGAFFRAQWLAGLAIVYVGPATPHLLASWQMKRLVVPVNVGTGKCGFTAMRWRCWRPRPAVNSLPAIARYFRPDPVVWDAKR